MKVLVFRSLAPTLATLALSVSATAQTIDNLSGWNGTTGLGFFGTGGGYSSANTYGQTFIAPTESFLKSWETSFANGNNGSKTFQYRLYIAPWDAVNDRLAGASLFTSGILTSPTGQYASLKVDANVLLVPGVKYVACTSTTQFSPVYDPAVVTAAQAGFYQQDTYADGGFVMQAGGSFAELAVNGWDTRFVSSGWDTAFRAEFQAVPEPTTFVPLGMGALALIARLRKRS